MKTLHIALYLAALVAASCSPSSPDASQTKRESGGSVVSGGGDFLRCRPAAGSPYNGLYMLDYAVTYDLHDGTSQDPAETSFDALMARTTKIVDEKLPELSASWRTYAALVQSGDPSKPRRWTAANNLTDLHDEALPRELDANCMVERDGKSVPDLTQMVRRSFYVGGQGLQITYEYNLPLFDAAKASNALQLSYLVVHEWLWDFIREPNANRLINRLIHSRSVETMTPGQVRTFLQSKGVTTDEAGAVGAVSEREKQLFKMVDDSDTCDSSLRVAASFPVESGRVTVHPGKTERINLKTPRLYDSFKKGICGFAFVYGYRAVGQNSQVTVTLHRGQGFERFEHQASTGNVVQELQYGLCTTEYCRSREGIFSYYFKPGEGGTSNYQLEVSVPEHAAGAVDVSYPYLVFYASAIDFSDP